MACDVVVDGVEVVCGCAVGRFGYVMAKDEVEELAVVSVVNDEEESGVLVPFVLVPVVLSIFPLGCGAVPMGQGKCGKR